MFIEMTVLISLFLIVYHHVVFPVFLKMVNTFSKEQENFVNNRSPYSQEGSYTLPEITVLIPAYNEEKYIAEKIMNLAAVDYPANRLRVIIGCDGCTDRTHGIAQQTVKSLYWSDTRFEVINYRKNQGKVITINKLMNEVDTELVALSDVSALLSIDSLLIVAKRFKNPAVGAVTGSYKLFTPGSDGESSYWKYQANIKRAESIMGSTIGAHGAFYVIRRGLFREIPTDIINDDFYLPMKIVEAGYKVEYETLINAVELEGSSTEMEWNRRLRIGAGNMQQIIKLKSVLRPKYAGVCLNFFSGKFLRVLVPYLLIVSLIGSGIAALSNPYFLALFACQIIGYTASLVYIKHDIKFFRKVGQPIAYIVLGHFANLCGSLRYFSGSANLAWKKVQIRESGYEKH